MKFLLGFITTVLVSTSLKPIFSTNNFTTNGENHILASNLPDINMIPILIRMQLNVQELKN